MKIKIYQIDPGKDTNQVLYLGLKTLSLKNYQVDNSIYDVVFHGEVKANDLEDVYKIFNISDYLDDLPSGRYYAGTKLLPVNYKGRSLSTSDIVEVIEGNEETPIGFYFCDRIGFKKIDFIK